MKRIKNRPKGFRKLKLGETIRAGDFAVSKKAMVWVDYQTFINEHPVLESDGNLYFRKIK